MPRFSIVVPIYNVENYLREALDSLVNQTFGDFEAICVNDCSPDSSRTIAQEYCDKDQRFKLVDNKENLSLYASRHHGVQHTTGEYVLFLDGDDAFTLDALENVDRQLSKRPVDILAFQMKVVIDPASGLEYDPEGWYARKYPPVFLQGDDIIRTICYERATDMGMHHHAFNGDLVRKVLPEMGFARDIIVAEDIAELTALMVNSKTFESLDNAEWYIYNIGRGQNGHVAEMSREEFFKESNRKRKCYRELVNYLDRTNAHTPLIDQAVATRWRYTCAESLGPWHTRVALDEKPQALADFLTLWPDHWVLPFAYEKIAYDADILLKEEDLTSPESKAVAKRMNATIKSVLPVQWNHETAAPAILADIKSLEDSAAGVEEALAATVAGSCDRAAIDMLLHSLRLLCFGMRDHICRVADLEDKVHWLEVALQEISESRRYKIGDAISKPYTALQNMLHRG